MTTGTLGLGAWTVRFVRTTSDLLVASRADSTWWNAAAISGEYPLGGELPRHLRAGAEARSQRPVASRRLHRGVLVLLVIGGFYLLPQLKGTGLPLGVVVGTPYWVGVVVVAAIVAVNVAIGGMRGITYVQAVQFWVKVFAISVPAGASTRLPRCSLHAPDGLGRGLPDGAEPAPSGV